MHQGQCLTRGRLALESGEMDDFFEGLFTKNGKLHEKTKTIKIEELSEESAFQRTEETFLDAENGTRTLETAAVHMAGCGHILLSPNNLKGHCQICGLSLCESCAEISCARCRSVVCPACSRIYQGKIFCRKCRAITFSQNTGLSGLRALHSLMKKEIA